jgi:hypothetical protein
MTLRVAHLCLDQTFYAISQHYSMIDNNSKPKLTHNTTELKRLHATDTSHLNALLLALDARPVSPCQLIPGRQE